MISVDSVTKLLGEFMISVSLSTITFGIYIGYRMIQDLDPWDWDPVLFGIYTHACLAPLYLPAHNITMNIGSHLIDILF